MIKKLLPTTLKIKIHLFIRFIKDVSKGYYFLFAKNSTKATDFTQNFTLKQDLKPNDAKKHNLLLAINAIEKVEIQPKEIFSFWKIVGNPTIKNGFVKSRSIVNGKVEASVGGGLCQLSGLIYYMSLFANLEILERYNHSIDIYTDETRFTPLGSDATVAYGYKDLRIRNTTNAPLKFTFSIDEDTITVKLNYRVILKKNSVEFKKEDIDQQRIKITTLINQRPLDTSIYKTLN